MNRFFLLMLLFCYSLNAENKTTCFKLTIPTRHIQQASSVIEKEFDGPKTIKKLTFESEVFFPQEEFLYITDLFEGKCITAADIENALFYLELKNKFEYITLQVKKRGNYIDLHFIFTSFTTFAKLKIHGILISKDNYRQYYLLEPDEPFDQKKHEHSLKKIKEAFCANGFFKGVVTDTKDYDEKTKSVTVHLNLRKGSRFSIDQVSLNITSENTPKEEIDHIKTRLQKKFLNCLVHKGYSKEKINSITQRLKRYLALKGFLYVSIILKETIHKQTNRVDLVFSIELHTKKEFIFVGNQFFSSDQLLEHILLFGQSAWLVPSSILSQELEKAYHDNGFWDIEVKEKEEDSRSFFIISEGERAVIKKIEFKGIAQIDPVKLMKNEMSYLLDSYVNIKKITNALERISAFYLEKGFWDFTILKHEFVPIKDNDYKLVITVEEGKRSYLHGVTIPGFDELSKNVRFTKYSPAKQEPFTMALLQEQKEWLVNYFHEKGFANVIIKPEVEKDDGAIFLQWHIEQGEKKVTFGKTILVGSHSNNAFHNVMREVPFKQGDIWNQQKVKESFVRIKNLNIFESLHIYPVKGPTDHEKAVIIKVCKDDPCELRLRAGFGAQQISQRFAFRDFTYKAGGTFILKNPLQAADLIVIDGDFYRSYHSIRAEYIRPWLFKMPIQNIYKIYNDKYQYPGLLEDKKNLYKVVQQGFLIGVNRKWDHLDFGMNAGFEWMETTISSELPQSTVFMDRVARAINFKPQLLDKKIPYFQLEPTILIDLLNNNLDPTRGSLTLATLKGMFPLAKVSVNAYFLRILLEQSIFIPAYPLVFAFRIRFGHIFHEQFNSIMPSERFYLGGANSIRSYETDMAPPLGKIRTEKCEKNFVPKGGKSMVNINAEVRFPIYKKFGAVIFQDFGALACSCIKELRSKKLLAGTGFGLRYNTPIGPLRFDLAWKWHVSDPSISRYAWYVTFGQAF